MAELADAHGSGPCESNFMQVQVLLPAPRRGEPFWLAVICYTNHGFARRDAAPFPQNASRFGGPYFSSRTFLTDKSLRIRVCGFFLREFREPSRNGEQERTARNNASIGTTSSRTTYRSWRHKNAAAHSLRRSGFFLAKLRFAGSVFGLAPVGIYNSIIYEYNWRKNAYRRSIRKICF